MEKSIRERIEKLAKEGKAMFVHKVCKQALKFIVSSRLLYLI